MSRILSFFRSEVNAWPEWWKSQRGFRRHGLLILVLLYWGVLQAIGGFRSDHLTTGFAMLGLWYLGPTARTLFYFLIPVFLTGIVYDSQRYYGAAIRGEVRVAWPYEFDMAFFGIDTPEGRLTPNEFWQTRTRPWLDLVTGFFYLFFIAIYVAICFYHRFILPQISKKPVQRLRAQQVGNQLTWAFFWLNLIGYSTYYWFPAAPPWYVVEYGFGPVNLDAAPSAAGALRFDELLGITVFSEMYSRSGNIFGAIPSLHISYPLLSMLFSYHLGSLRVFTTFFYLVMCFSAVYLNHHYIIDLIWGSAYAIFVFWLTIAYIKWTSSRRKPRM